MPKGVEHVVNAGTPKQVVRDVMNAVMPKGVEHLRSQRSGTSCRCSEERSDAERR